MGKVSKKIINKDIEERMFEVFWDALTKTKSPQIARKFMESFISDVEHLMLAKRFAIALMLAKGYSYQEIEDTLKVSSATIMSVGIRNKVGGRGLSPALKGVLAGEKMQGWLDNIEEWLLMLAPQARYGSYRHQKRQEKGLKIYKSKKKREVF